MAGDTSWRNAVSRAVSVLESSIILSRDTSQDRTIVEVRLFIRNPFEGKRRGVGGPIRENQELVEVGARLVQEPPPRVGGLLNWMLVLSAVCCERSVALAAA
jgi:hypothetical protein